MRSQIITAIGESDVLGLNKKAIIVVWQMMTWSQRVCGYDSLKGSS